MPLQRIIPMISYENGPAAMDWLIRVFGFAEKERWLGENGELTHGEVTLGGQSILLATPTRAYQSPKTVREKYEPAREAAKVPYVFDGVLVYVDDVEAHFRQSSAEGVTILSAIEGGGPGKRYRAEDLEGHRWYFMQAPLSE